jgi:hypothetical protein
MRYAEEAQLARSRMWTLAHRLLGDDFCQAVQRECERRRDGDCIERRCSCAEVILERLPAEAFQ